MSWQNRVSCIPIHLLGDNVKSNYRYTKARRVPNAHRRGYSPIFIWFPLLDALRRFVVQPFDGPWTPNDIQGE